MNINRFVLVGFEPMSFRQVVHSSTVIKNVTNYRSQIRLAKHYHDYVVVCSSIVTWIS